MGNMTIEERLYLLKEMKENCEKNAAYLHTIPERRRNSDSVESFSSNISSESDDIVGDNLLYITKIIKTFIFKCIICTMIFLGFNLCKKQENAELNETIATFSSELKKEEINNDILQEKVDNTIKQLLSKKLEDKK